jgi:arylsulfatase A-like enzyme
MLSSEATIPAWRLLSLAILLVATVRCAPGPERGLANIVLITIDTLRVDRLSCYGYYLETSPEIDRFARDAILFENAFTHMANTLPAHASLLTSTHPLRHGVRGNLSDYGVPFRTGSELQSLPQMLGRLGYQTAAIVSAAPLKKLTGISVGFQSYVEPVGIERRAAETTDLALAWIKSRSSAPFFLWVHYFDPHAAYDPPDPFDRMFSTDERQLRYLEENEFTYWDHPTIQEYNRLYDGEIRYVDSEIGRLLRRLQELALDASSAIVITSDHGEGLGQHDWMTHDRVYEELLHVPLIVKLPAGSGVPPRRSARLVGLVDVVPTLAEELELPLSQTEIAQLEGENALRGPDREFVFSERTLGRGDKVGPGEQFTLTSLAWKYFFGTVEPAELYDRRKDAGETRNVIDEYPEVAEALRALVLSRVGGSRASDSTARTPDLPEEYIEEMRALGYVD